MIVLELPHWGYASVEGFFTDIVEEAATFGSIWEAEAFLAKRFAMNSEQFVFHYKAAALAHEDQEIASFLGWSERA